MYETITSSSNPTVKQLRKLMASSKERRETNTFVAEGVHLVRSFLATGETPRRHVFSVSALKNPEVTELLLTLDDMDSEPVVIADSLFESLASIHASVGILITFSPVTLSIDAILPLKDTAILLEDIQDPGNIGTILRTAAATGVKNLLLSPGCTSPWSPKALRAGMGAQFSLALYEDVDLAKSATAATIPTVATVLGNDSKSLYDLELHQPIAWLFGSEGVGISDSLAQLASIHVTIPQASSSVESLNVAAAVAVCLYEQFRQNSLQ